MGEPTTAIETVYYDTAWFSQVLMVILLWAQVLLWTLMLKDVNSEI